MLDPKGLEAAAQAMMPHDPGPQIVEIVRKDAEKAITAYLSTITPAEVGGLVDAQTEARALAERLTRQLTRAEEGAGTMPARQAVKLHPDDWNGLCRLVREAVTALVAKDAELAAYRRRNDELETTAQKLVSANIRERVLQDKLERAEDQLAEARKALEWHPIETAPLNTTVDLWCTYADAPASWGNDRPAGQIVHNRHKSKEHGWFGNESNDGIPQANGPDLVPVAWRWPAPEIPLEMMERFVAARRALEAQGGENG